MHDGLTHEPPVSETVEWFTPCWVFDRLGVEFDLDPCAPVGGGGCVPTRWAYTREQDGLTSPWVGHCWVNPPYGREIGRWLDKLADHGDGIALLFARTDTRWFHDQALRAQVICFMPDRMYFTNGRTGERGGRSAAGSMLLGYGEWAAQVVRASGLGLCIGRG